MSRKSKVTQEMANGFPEWTRIRNDDQSNGKLFLNAIGLQMEPLVIELLRGEKNIFLSTAHVGEIDQTYNVDLPSYFSFTEIARSNGTLFEDPTLSGYQDATWYEVEIVDNGSLREFWYDALPTRASLVETINEDQYLVASGVSTDIELEIVNTDLLLDNRLSVKATGHPLLTIDEENNLLRSRIRVVGTTAKGTDEQEDIVFLFTDTKLSRKSWNTVTSVKPLDFTVDSMIHVYSHQFRQPFYLDSLETISQFEDTRENMPIFWSITEAISGGTTLRANRYSVKKATDLVRYEPQIVEYQNWELTDSNGYIIEAEDITPVPFEQRLYAVDNQTIHIFDTFFELPNTKELVEKTENPLVDIEASSDYLVPSEEIEIMAVFKRPIKTIVRHRIKITFPDGAEFGLLLDGTLVPTSADYWIREEATGRVIRPPFLVELDDLGDHIITLECVYFDGTSEVAQRILKTRHKRALASVDISTITTTAIGIDIDHLNRILVLDSSGSVHVVKFHYDLAIVDFLGKRIIFRENYDEVKVLK